MAKIYKIGDALEIPEPAEVTEAKRVWSNLLGTQVGFGIRNARKGSVEFYLNGQAPSLADGYTVLRLLQLKGTVFWTAMTLQFAYRLGEYEFQSASILFFSAVLSSSDSKVPLIRAEWDHSDRSTPPLHAQPHWHVYGATTDLGNSGAKPMARFHFAMASDWQFGNTASHYESHSTDKLKNWIRGCVSYTRSQLRYLNK